MADIACMYYNENTTQKQPMKMQLHIFYDIAQTKTVIRK